MCIPKKNQETRQLLLLILLHFKANLPQLGGTAMMGAEKKAVGHQREHQPHMTPRW